MLGANQMNRLRINDIIFFDRSWHDDRKQILVKIAGNTGFLAIINDQTVTLKNTMEAPMSDDLDDLDDFDDDLDLDDDLDDLDDELDDDADEKATPPQEKTPEAAPTAAASAPPDMNNIPVQLTFDVGKQEIPLGNISQLAPGFTFQLNRDLASPVTVHANGKPMAEGELVDVNGQLGTRITRML